MNFFSGTHSPVITWNAPSYTISLECSKQNLWSHRWTRLTLSSLALFKTGCTQLDLLWCELMVFSCIKEFTTLIYSFYNPPNNFFGLSLDKTDQVIQDRTMVIRWYPRPNLIFVIWFYFNRIKAKKRASIQAKLLIGHGKQKNTFCRSQLRRN